ncbi:MAG: polynucleotide adenylyltransferase PcnB [Leptospiraceae bacterium]|nr:polynucleotide adenylyltransferase PcnB [Leptospiraceae bacterium]
MKYILNLFRKKSGLEEFLKYPEGKRYYREVHGIKKTQLDDDALKIIHRLTRYGHKAYLVGGCIRDLLLEKKPKDFDIATSATPNQIKNIFNNARIIGKRFKIVHVIFKNKIIEVTTFRSLPDHRVSKKTPKEGDYLLKRDNNFGTAKEDAVRRDVSVNALYYDPRNETIIDFVGGYEDIKNKVVRVIGNPDISFQEDPVRMLRAVKISVLHGLEIDKKTKLALKKNRGELEKASSARMLEEYNKIFRTLETSNIFKGLAENHLLEVLFKEALTITAKTLNWEENFLETPIGTRLAIADRKLKEREELTPIIYYSLIFSEIVADAIQKKKGNLVPIIKATLEPIFKRISLPNRDRDRIIKIFASQNRFLKTNDANSQQIEIFRSKDFFYEAFMFFKFDAEARKDEVAIQAAFFWEISMRIRPEKNLNRRQNHSNNQKQDKVWTPRKNKDEKVSTSVIEDKKAPEKETTQIEKEEVVIAKEQKAVSTKQERTYDSTNAPMIELEEATLILYNKKTEADDSSQSSNSTEEEKPKRDKQFYKKRYRGKKFRKFPNKNSGSEASAKDSGGKTET